METFQFPVFRPNLDVLSSGTQRRALPRYRSLKSPLRLDRRKEDNNTKPQLQDVL